MNDEKLYLEATNEVEGENRDSALWAKAMAICDGDENKAKYEYIRARVRYLLEREKDPSKTVRQPNSEEAVEISSQQEPVLNKNEDVDANDEELMAEFGIIFDGEAYRFQEYRYERRNDAINYAKLVRNKSEPPKTIARSTNTEKPIVDYRGFIHKLSDGGYGLAKTYWVYGVLVGVVVNIAVEFIESASIIIALMLAYILYEVPVLLGIWSASNKYTGPSLWVILAKIATVLGWLWLGIGLVVVFRLLNA
jgi:hypothetical protein